jgi:uncharacterized protein YjaZ
MMHSISPTIEEFREAREIVESSLSIVEKAFPIERDVIVGIGWDRDDFTEESLDGASGFASYPNRIELTFNTAAENWRESLKSSTVHEYAHVWGYEKRGQESQKKWEYILEEAFTQHIAKDLVPEYQSPWWTKHNTQEIATYWDHIKEDEFLEPSEEAGPIFISTEDERYPLGLGYSLSYQLGQELLTEHDLHDFPALHKEALVRAGNQLYVSD